MRRFTEAVLVVVAACVVVPSLCWSTVLAAERSSAESPDAESAAAAAKSRKYHAILRKRPEPGYLFDRFYNTWLDESTVDALRDFLVAQADSGETADALLLAFFHSKQGDDAAALQAYAEALAEAPGSPAVLFHKAAAEARTLDFEAAVADLKQARTLDPDDKLSTQIDQQLGKLLVRNRETAQALEVWQGLLAAHPDDEELHEDVLELHIDEGLYEEAAKLAEQLIERTKDKYLAVTRRLRLGDIHYRAGSRSNALETYASTLADVGHETWIEREILAQIEQLFRREDDLSGARKYFDELLEAHPKRIAIHQRRARLLADLGEHDEAKAAHREILELTPGDRSNRETYIALLASIEQHDEAIGQLRALIEQHPDDAELTFQLAGMLQEASQSADAEQAIRDYLAQSDRSEYAFLRAARQLQRFERPEAAGQIYEEMVAAFPESAGAREAQAAFSYAQGKKDEALQIWQTIAAEGDLTQTLHVARAMSTRGENRAAYELLASREQEFADEPLFLGQIVAAALAEEEYEAAVRWAQRRVELADQSGELLHAIDQAALACDRAERLAEVAAQLADVAPRTVQQTCLLAELHEQLGDSRAADQVLAESGAATHVLGLSQQIRLYESRRQWAEAADATRRLLELPGGRKSIHVRRLVELYQRDYKFAEALPWIDVWKQLSPGSTLPWTAEARLLQYDGRPDDALLAMRKAVQKFQDDADLRARLAQMYAESDRPGDAEQLYWQLYESTEDLAGKLRWVQELAKLAESQGKVEQLVASFDERRRNNRRSIGPLLALSEVHRVADNFEERRQALTAAAQIKPDDLQLLLQIARIEEAEGNWQRALATLQQAAELDKTSRTRRKIADLHLTYGDEEKGFALLLDLANVDGGDPRAVEAVADTMVGLGEWERAADYLAERLDDHPGDYRLRYLYGVALEESGRIEASIREYMALLEKQEELPSKNQGQAAMQGQNSYLQAMARMMPPRAIEWLQLSQYRYSAYAHQQQRRSVSAYMAGASRQSNIQYPPSAELVRPYALAHLLTTAGLLDEEQLEVIAGQLAQAGISDIDLLIEFGSTPQGLQQNLPTLLEANPDHETALALYVMTQMGQQTPHSLPHARRAYELFREDYPELAFLAAIQAGQAMLAGELPLEATEEENSQPTDSAAGESAADEMFDAALALADTIDAPGPNTVMGTALLLGGRPGQPRGVEVSMSDAYREKFSQLLLAWYPHMQQNPVYGRYAFLYVMRALETGGNAEAFVDFVADEAARWSSQGGRGPNVIQSMYGRQANQQLLVRLTSPPRQLAEFAPHVLTVLHPPGGHDPFGQATDAAANYDPEEFLPRLSKLANPVLRILLAMKVDGDRAEEMVDQTLQELLSAESPQLDAYLLAAGRAMEQERLVEGLEYLEKARYLPMKRDLRKQVDAAIVAAVLELEGATSQTDEGIGAAIKKFLRRAQAEAEPTEQDGAAAAAQWGQAGRDAALRLRRSRLIGQERLELITALEELGLKEEADRLDQAAVRAGPAAATPAAVYAIRPVAAGPQDRIQKLLKAGKQDAAVRLLGGEATNLARQSLNNPANSYYYQRQFDQLLGRIQTHDLIDEVFDELDPGESRSPQRVAEFAAVCELFGKPEQARAAYEKLLERRPRDEATRMRLAILLAKTDMSAAREHVGRLSATSSQVFGQMLWQRMQNHQAPIEEKLDYGQLSLDYLISLAEDRRAQTSWAPTAISLIGHAWHQQNQQLASLYDRAPARRETPSSLADVQARRVALHRGFCEQMLKMPSLARTGFSHLLAVSEANGDLTIDPKTDAPDATPDDTPDDAETARQASDDPPGDVEAGGAEAESPGSTARPLDRDAFTQIAVDLLLAEASSSGTGQTVQSISYSTNNPSQAPFRSPEEFLVRAAAATGHWEQIDQELLPRLQAGRGRDAARRLELYAALYRSSPEQFHSAATAALKSRPATPGPSSNNEQLTLVIEAWRDREAAVDLFPLFEAEFRRGVAMSRGQQTPSYVDSYLKALVGRGDLETAEKVLEEVADRYIGPAERRRAIVRANYTANSWSPGTINGNINVYARLLERLLQDPDLLFVVLDHLAPLGDAAPIPNLEYRLREANREILRKEPEAIVAMLERSPWLAELDAFRVLAVGSEVDEWPLVRFLGELRNRRFNDEQREGLLESLPSPATFGVRLIQAFLAKEDHEQALLAEIKASIGAIEQLPSRRQNDLAALLRRLLGDVADDLADEDPQSAAVGRWLDQQLGSRSEEIVRRFVEAKKIEDLGVEQHELDTHLARVIGELASIDSEATQVVFARMCKLAADAQRRGQYHFHQGNGHSVAGSVLDRMCMRLRHEGQLSHCVALLDIIQRSSIGPIEVARNVEEVFVHVLRQAFEELAESQEHSGDRGDASLAALKALAQQMESRLGDRRSDLLIGACRELTHNRLDEAQRTAFIAWLEQQRAAGETEGNLYESFELATRLSLLAARTDEADRDRVAELSLLIESRLRDDQLTVGERACLLEMFRRNARERLPFSTRVAAVELYVEAIEGDVPILSHQHRGSVDLALSLLDSLEEDRDGQVGPLLDQLRAAWADRFLGRPATRSPGVDLNSVSDVRSLAMVLQLFIAAGDSQAVRQVIAKYDSRLGSDPQAIIALVRAGEPKLAAQILRGHYFDMRIDAVQNLPIKYDPELHERRAAFAAEMAREAESYYADLLMASLGDRKQSDEDGAGAALPARTDRLSAAARRFSEIDFEKSPGIERRVLDLLATDATAAKIVEEPLAEAYKTIDFVGLARRNDDNATQQGVRLAAAHFRNRLAEGDVEPAVETMEVLSQQWIGNEYYYGRALPPVITAIQEGVEQYGSSWSPSAAAAVAEALRNVLKDRDHFWLPNRDQYVRALVAVHAVAGESKQVFQWLPTISESSRDQMKNRAVDATIWEIGRKIYGEPSAENRQARVEFARHVLQIAADLAWVRRFQPWVYGLQSGQPRSLVDQMIEKGLLTESEALEEGAELVASFDPGSLVTAAMAGWLHQREQYAAAAPLWQTLADATDADSKNWSRAEWNLGLAKALYETGDTAGARAALAAVLPARLGDRQPKLYRDLQKKLDLEQEEQQEPDAVDETPAVSAGVECAGLRLARDC